MLSLALLCIFLCEAVLGEVLAFGTSAQQQTGVSGSPIVMMSNEQFASVSAGAGFSVARGTSGSLYTIGANDKGQLGLGDYLVRNTVTLVTTSLLCVSIAAGDSHVLMVTTDGSVYVWGENSYGQLGINSTQNSRTLVNLLVPGLVAISIAAGKSHSAVVDTRGLVYTMGAGTYNQLGLGSSAARWTPTSVIISGETIVGVACGDQHTLVVAASGKCFGWGFNSKGQLGLGDNLPRGVPTQLPVPSIRYVAAGALFSILLSPTATVFVAGDNSAGQLGLEGVQSSTVSIFTDISRLSELGVVYISAGGATAAYLVADMSVFGVGDSSEGQLGQNGEKSATFKQLSGLSSATQISVSSTHVLVVASPAQVGLPKAAIVIIVVVATLVPCLIVCAIFFWRKRTQSQSEYRASIKAENAARARLNMISAEERKSESLWNVLSEPSATQRVTEADKAYETFGVASTAANSDRPFLTAGSENSGREGAGGREGGGGREGAGGGGQVVENLDLLPPWKPEEDNEPILARRIITSVLRHTTAQIATSLLLSNCGKLDSTQIKAAADLYERGSSAMMKLHEKGEMEGESEGGDEEEEEEIQLEASVVPGPVRGWVKKSENSLIDPAVLLQQFANLKDQPHPQIGLG